MNNKACKQQEERLIICKFAPFLETKSKD